MTAGSCDDVRLIYGEFNAVSCLAVRAAAEGNEHSLRPRRFMSLHGYAEACCYHQPRRACTPLRDCARQYHDIALEATKRGQPTGASEVACGAVCLLRRFTRPEPPVWLYCEPPQPSLLDREIAHALWVLRSSIMILLSKDRPSDFGLLKDLMKIDLAACTRPRNPLRCTAQIPFMLSSLIRS